VDVQISVGIQYLQFKRDSQALKQLLATKDQPDKWGELTRECGHRKTNQIKWPTEIAWVVIITTMIE
jgi:hypothetical protein